MDSNPTNIRKIGIFEVCEINGRTFKRRSSGEEWREADLSLPEPSSIEPVFHLLVVKQEQASGISHWLLSVVPDEEWAKAMTFQVKGDVLHMTYSSKQEDVSILNDFLCSYEMGSIGDNGSEIVAKVAEGIPAPHADNMREVQGNCQTWAYQVVQELVKKNIIPEAKLESLVDLMDAPAKSYMKTAGIV